MIILWESHWGKILSSVLTAIILAAFWGFSGFVYSAIEAKAEDWVNERMEKRLVEQNTVLSQQYGELKTQQSGTRNQINDLQGQLRELNKNLTKILLHTLNNDRAVEDGH